MELLRHRHTKEAATDRFHLQPPRHISTPPRCAGFRRSGLSSLFTKRPFVKGVENRRFIAITGHPGILVAKSGTTPSGIVCGPREPFKLVHLNSALPAGATGEPEQTNPQTRMTVRASKSFYACIIQRCTA